MLDSVRLNRPATKAGGFTLIEMAMVLLIMSLLTGGLLMSLSENREMINRTDAEKQLENFTEALYGFAQANGRLPCPATAVSNGLESPVGGGACTQSHGFIPIATLGLSGSVDANGLVVDKWVSPYRYSVTTANASAFTTAGGMRAAGMAALAADMRVCTTSVCAAVVASNLPVVLLSLGKDWPNFTSANEVENSGETTIAGFRHANDLDFVSTTYGEDIFDDLITWISPSILYTRMIAAGQLP